MADSAIHRREDPLNSFYIRSGALQLADAQVKRHAYFGCAAVGCGARQGGGAGGIHELVINEIFGSDLLDRELHDHAAALAFRQAAYRSGRLSWKMSQETETLVLSIDRQMESPDAAASADRPPVTLFYNKIGGSLAQRCHTLFRQVGHSLEREGGSAAAACREGALHLQGSAAHDHGSQSNNHPARFENDAPHPSILSCVSHASAADRLEPVIAALETEIARLRARPSGSDEEDRKRRIEELEAELRAYREGISRLVAWMQASEADGQEAIREARNALEGYNS